jgi:effector-binding domain-containing protein
MIDEPQIAQTSAQRSALIHVTCPRDKIREVMGPGYTELMDTLKAQGITPAGPWYTRHFRMDPEVFDFEIGTPIAGDVQPAGRVVPGELPAARVVRTVYHGPYEELPGAWSQFDAWIAANGHEPDGSLWEAYRVGPESGDDPSGWQTELSRPLK